MKYLVGLIIGAVVGGLLGFLIGSGETNWIKKSQKENSFPVLAFGGVIVGAICGVLISNAISKEEKESSTFGFANSETYESKSGRKWELLTIWTNPSTLMQNQIKTFFSNELNSVITSFNDTPIFTHNSSNGSKVFVQKVHLQSVSEIKRKISNSELSMI